MKCKICEEEIKEKVVAMGISKRTIKPILCDKESCKAENKRRNFRKSNRKQKAVNLSRIAFGN